ncbi:MAG: hypothetical protein EZS28_014652 [Streblomastix strix]|uniref:Uncharacterized protein n=1 Tax=Streblomastix strix TaxID=222440 RepID=A0A5J4W504_9EUKA|nr:MAG: hypothetical protein EZS28_014652 [Streblomastix strix]
MVRAERDKIQQLMKEKQQLVQSMKTSFLDLATPLQLKENIGYSICDWQLIENAEDPCFKPVIDLLFEQLKCEEERMNNPQYDFESDQRRHKYGLKPIEQIIENIASFCLSEYKIKKELIQRGAIEIGMKYLTHPSALIKCNASILFGLMTDEELGANFRRDKDCLSLLNSYLPSPILRVIPHSGQKTHHYTIQHLKQLHSGFDSKSGMCINCDLKLSQSPTSEIHWKQQKFDIRTLLISDCQRDFLVLETKQIHFRLKIREIESKENQQTKIQLDSEIKGKPDKDVVKCSLSAIPIIFSLIQDDEVDYVVYNTLWCLDFLLVRLFDLAFEEREEEEKKTMDLLQNLKVECQECGQILPQTEQLLHVKIHKNLDYVHFRVKNYSYEQDDDESNSTIVAQKRMLEDIEGEGLQESVESHIFREKVHNLTQAQWFQEVLLGLNVHRFIQV